MNDLDVSHLPRYAFGRRSALYWGVLLFIAIESTALAIMLASYLYVRGNFDVWPAGDRMRPLSGIVTAVVLVASCIPMHLAIAPCHRLDVRPTRRRVLAGALLGLAGCGLRAWEIAEIPFRWTDNAYGSVVWMTYGLHTAELVASVLEALVMAAVLYRGPIEDKHFEDVEVTALFWYFANLVWLPFAGLFYLDGYLR